MISQNPTLIRIKRAREARESARDLIAAGDYVKARDDYRIAMLSDPRMISEIILDYERALEKSSGDIGLRLSLADFYFKMGDVRSLLIELEEIIDVDPKMAPVYSILGQILLKQGAIDETILLLERALKENIKNTSLIEMLAGAYLEGGEISRSIMLYEEILQLDPASKNTLRILGDLYNRINKNSASAAMYLKLYEIDPATYDEVVHKLSLLLKGDDALNIREMLASLYLKGRDPESAVNEYKHVFKKEKHRVRESIDKYKRALETYPGHPSLIAALSDALIETGSFTEAAHELAKLSRMGGELTNTAIQGYLKIIKRYPDNVLAHQFLGDAYFSQGKHEDAIAQYRIVVSMDEREADNISKKCRDLLRARPDLSSLHLLLGEIYIIKKDYKKAISEGEDALGIDPDSVDAFILLGDGYEGDCVYVKASDSYRMALVHDPHNIALHKKLEASRKNELNVEIKMLKNRIKEDPWRKSLHLDLAKLHYELMDWDSTAREVQEALRDQARAPFAYNLFGLALKEEGKYELAAHQFAKALELLPGELGEVKKNILFNLATTYEILGRVEDAISYYEKVREMDVGFADVQNKINGLNAVNPKSVRDKMFALLLQNLSSSSLLAIWGRDSRQVSSRKSEELGMSFAQTHNDKGFEHMAKGLHKSAEEEFVLASSLDAKLPCALNNLAVVYAGQGRLDDAKMRLSQALEEDPKSAVLHNNIAVIAYLRSDYKTAELELLRALSIDPDLLCAHINLGDAYYSQGNAKAAIGHWQKVKTFSPVSELAARRLKYRVPDHQ